MITLSIRRFSFAMAGAITVFYLGCVLVMLTVPKEAAVRFFNSISHGIDWGPIMRWDMPAWEVILGVVEVFILGWLFGAIVATLYNFGAPPRRRVGGEEESRSTGQDAPVLTRNTAITKKE